MKVHVVLWACVTIGWPLASFGAQNETEEKEPATIGEKTAEFEKSEGYFETYWDEKAGKLWVEIDRWDEEFLYVTSLAAGVGSNDIGLDRGQLGRSRIVRFTRIGPKVLLIQPNYAYRAESESEAERRAVAEAFAESTLWGFKIEAEEDGRALVDATEFFLRDAHNVAQALKRTNQGTFKLEDSRSAFYLPRTRNFPKNTEFEVTLTFTGAEPGRWLREVVPSPDSVTVRQHHSFIELPDGDYEPRVADPRAGFFGISYMDFATPIGEPIRKRYISRHRLKKKDPGAELGEPVERIVYYLDRGAPEPIRSALLEGARWWNEAFEAAGYLNAFSVQLLPEGADPMDVRYNLIQWVHRSTRGWSYGSSVADPRTGEIIKGHVTLGSLRVRQDYLIAEALLAPYEAGEPVPEAMERLAIARLRQLSAHEVGHTLGLAHNFASSANSRASVMDYPHPLVRLAEDGSFDLSEAYDEGIGEWDKAAIAYGYRDFGPGSDETSGLKKIIEGALERGLMFISDQDARPAGGAHPKAHLWDNGPDAAAELVRVMEVRRHALKRFSSRNIREGRPMATLEEVLAPLYMLHRYQVEAAAKVLGGLDYSYAVRGDGQIPTAQVDPEAQRAAMKALLATLDTEALAIPEHVLTILPPRAYGLSRGRENLPARTGPTFDPMAAAETAAHHTVRLMLNPQRATRLVEYHARDRKAPGLGEVIDGLIEASWKSRRPTGYQAEIGRVVDEVVLYHLFALAENADASAQVRALARLKLEELRAWTSKRHARSRNEGPKAHYRSASKRIARFQENPQILRTSEPLRPPAGSPIGSPWTAGGPLVCDWQ